MNVLEVLDEEPVKPVVSEEAVEPGCVLSTFIECDLDGSCLGLGEGDNAYSRFLPGFATFSRAQCMMRSATASASRGLSRAVPRR